MTATLRTHADYLNLLECQAAWWSHGYDAPPFATYRWETFVAVQR